MRIERVGAHEVVDDADVLPRPRVPQRPVEEHRRRVDDRDEQDHVRGEDPARRLAPDAGEESEGQDRDGQVERDRQRREQAVVAHPGEVGGLQGDEPQSDGDQDERDVELAPRGPRRSDRRRVDRCGRRFRGLVAPCLGNPALGEDLVEASLGRFDVRRARRAHGASQTRM